MEENHSRQSLLYLSLALTASVCLAVTIAYLEIRRDAEVESLRNEVVLLLKYVEVLKEKINRTDSFQKKIEDILALESRRMEPSKLPVAENERDDRYDDDGDYDEYEDYEYDDLKGSNSTPREKRSIDENGGRFRNILHMRTHPMIQHNSENAPVMARIVISGADGDSVQPRPDDRNYEYHRTKQEEVRHQKKNENKLKDVENINGCEHKPIFAHFGGDTSEITRERHYEANHRMYHPEGLFKEWLPAKWVSSMDMDSEIEINRGTVTIVDSPGIYYFYSQIFYADTHDSSGYRVLVNNRPVLQCTTSAMSSHNSHHIKRNSCFTGGLIKLDSGDNITLRELEGRRYTVFEPTRSFFGLFRVAQTQSS